MQEITDDVLQAISGDIEKLLLEQREGIAFACRKIPEGIKVSIGVELDQTTDGVAVNYTVTYPLEPKPETRHKQKVQQAAMINFCRGDLQKRSHDA